MLQLRLIAGMDGANLYHTPGGLDVVARILSNDALQSLESAEDTERKTGLPREWINVSTSDGASGYIGAWLVRLTLDNLAGVRSGEWREFARPRPLEERQPVDDSLKASSADAKKAVKTPIEIEPDDSTPSRMPIRSTTNLNLREQAVDGDVVQVAYKGTVLISLESQAATARKLGTKGEWLHLETIYGKQAYAAAWLLEPHDGPVPKPGEIPQARSKTGINLDVYNPLGKPDPTLLDGVGWARLAYNHSRNANFPHGSAQGHGNLDLAVSDAHYGAYLRELKRAGLRTIVVFTHQTWGEGRGFDFEAMGRDKDQQWVADKWRNEFTPAFIQKLKEITRHYEPEGLIDVYQIWNEPDYQGSPRAQILMNAKNFAYILSESVGAIKSIDPDAVVITGGHTSGPDMGPSLMKDALAEIRAMKGYEPDGVAFHPYGRGLHKERPFSHFGSIGESISKYSAVMPGKPVWMTEWGVLSPNHKPWFTLGNQVPSPDDIFTYVKEFMGEVHNKFNDDVAAAVWYGWAIGMDDGYGIVNERQEPLEPLYSGFKKL